MLQTFLRGKSECKFPECWNSTVLKRGAVSAKWFVFMWGRANEKQNTSFNSDGTEQNCDWVQIAGLIQFVRRQVIRFQLVCHHLQWSGRLKHSCHWAGIKNFFPLFVWSPSEPVIRQRERRSHVALIAQFWEHCTGISRRGRGFESRSEPEFFQVSVQVVLRPHLH